MSHLRRTFIPLIALAVAFAGADRAFGEPAPAELLQEAKRVLFLGDSITAAGGYITAFEAWQLIKRGASAPIVINAGLPSETVSGLSEEGHAGGKFPRPDLAERLDRILEKAKPDLVISCYGINCGIYEPFAEDRFRRYQEGYQRLKKQVEMVGAKLIVVTPPFYDDQRSPRSFSYNEVLDRYTDWLLTQREKGWTVIDLHTAMTKEAQRRRKLDPQFTFQPDGVHPNAAGQWFIAQQLIQAFGDDSPMRFESLDGMFTRNDQPVEALKLLDERMKLRRDAYVSAAGHKRPGVAAGLPIDEAEAKAKELTTAILKASGQTR